LLRRPSLRRLFNFSIFLDCSTRTRLQRRLARDLLTRGRTRVSVQQQFWNTVEPMHRKYVDPQARYAELVLHGDCGEGDIASLAEQLRYRLEHETKGDYFAARAF